MAINLSNANLWGISLTADKPKKVVLEEFHVLNLARVSYCDFLWLRQVHIKNKHLWILIVLVFYAGDFCLGIVVLFDQRTNSRDNHS